ncbi:hypothetical protein H310_15215, partial [Aphanomyces invadans]
MGVVELSGLTEPTPPPPTTAGATAAPVATTTSETPDPAKRAAKGPFADRTTNPGQSFADTVRMQGKRHPPPKHRDTPADASLQQAHAYCKNPSAAWTTHRRAPSPQEADILDAILDGRLPLDTPPKFLKQILTATEIALFHDQMRQNFGYLQIPIKVSTRIHPDMTSVSLARLFSPANLGDNKEAVQLCDSLRQDMHSCYLHPHGRKLIVQFNSKAKAARWRDKPIPFRGQLTWMRHYRRPEDPCTDLDTEEVQQHMAYSFRLLQVPAYVKSMQ